MDVVTDYHQWIEAISLDTGWSDTILHIYTGLALFLLAHLATGRSRTALLLVTLAEAGNETMDRLYFGNWHLEDTLPDVVHTLFWPFVLAAFLQIVRRRMLSAALRR